MRITRNVEFFLQSCIHRSENIFIFLIISHRSFKTIFYARDKDYIVNICSLCAGNMFSTYNLGHFYDFLLYQFGNMLIAFFALEPYAQNSYWFVIIINFNSCIMRTYIKESFFYRDFWLTTMISDLLPLILISVRSKKESAMSKIVIASCFDFASHCVSSTYAEAVILMTS